MCLKANLFAVCFGLAGLSQAWTLLMCLVHGPSWPGNAIWILTALVWLITVIGYLGNVAAQHRWRQELTDQTLGPFIALVFIVPMLLAVPLAKQARGADVVVFGCAATLTVLFGAWITGDWIARDGDIRRWHPGYYLPAAAGGLIAGGASAALGFSTLSHVLFGLGVGSYLLLGSIIGQRLFVVPEMPPALGLLLPPGGRLHLRPALARAEHVPGATALGYALVGLLSYGFLLLAARTIVALDAGTFFQRAPSPPKPPRRLPGRPPPPLGSPAR